MSNLSLLEIESGLSSLRTKYNREAGQLALLEQQQADKQLKLQQAKDDIEVWQQVQTLFSMVSEFSREQLKLRIEETVTAALQAVFCEDNIKFVVDIKVSDGKPVAEWTVVSSFGDFAVAACPEDAKGGGVTDVVSLALRLALLELARPKPMGPVILMSRER